MVSPLFLDLAENTSQTGCRHWQPQPSVNALASLGHRVRLRLLIVDDVVRICQEISLSENAFHWKFIAESNVFNHTNVVVVLTAQQP